MSCKKEVKANKNHKHSKKNKLKHQTFQFTISFFPKVFVIPAGVGDTHTATVPKWYRHLFYRDINPPPRFS